MSYTRRTGGEKEFGHPGDLEDTEPTRNFKDALREWRKNRKHKPEPGNFIEKYSKNTNSTSYQNGKKIDNSNHEGWITLAFLIIFILLVTFFIVVLVKHNDNGNIEQSIYVNTSKIVLINKTIIEQIPLNYSFQKYFDNLSRYDKQEITLVGFLERDKQGNALIKDYIVDDYNNKIFLKLYSTKYESEFYNELFVNGVTNSLFKATGILRRINNDLNLEIHTLSKFERENKEVEKIVEVEQEIIEEIPINLTIEKEALVPKLMNNTKNLFVNLINYFNEDDEEEPLSFYFEVAKNCTGNIQHNKCSTKKPLFCDNGTLIPRAEKCGCEQGYKEVGHGCEEILTCSDGTKYDKCSKDKPMKCINGDLITKATDCGCPYGKYQSGDYCLEFEDKIEKMIIVYTNEERNAHGRASLKADPELSKIARAHSEDMALNDFFSHVNQHGLDPTERAKQAGYPLHKEMGGGYYSEGIAENIGMMSSGDIIGIGYVSNDPDSIAKAHVQAWMDSPGHRENILNGMYDKIGVGTAYDGMSYVSTQNFW